MHAHLRIRKCTLSYGMGVQRGWCDERCQPYREMYSTLVWGSASLFRSGPSSRLAEAVSKQQASAITCTSLGPGEGIIWTLRPLQKIHRQL